MAIPAPIGRTRSTPTDWAIRLLAVLFLYISLWIALPGPTYPLLVLAVGAPEISPLLFASSIGLILLLLLRRTGRGIDRVAIGSALLTVLLSAMPLVQIPGTISRFDHAMRASLGNGFACAAPLAVRARMRPVPVAVNQFIKGIAPSNGVVIERGVEYARTVEGPLTLDLYRPAAAGDFPVVLDIYGGAWQRGVPFDDHQFASALARAGYLVVSTDYRHAPRWKYPAQFDDVTAAIHWIRLNAALYQGQPESVAIIGRSSGAELALLAAYRTDSAFIKGVVSYYGPVDLADGFRHPPSPDPLDIRSIQIDYLGGTPDQVPDRYRDASPITWVRPGLPPTLLIYGRRDHVVEPRFGHLLHDSLAAVGDTAVLLELPWSEHAFDKVPGGPGSQIAVYEVERFLGWVFGERSAGSCQ